MPEFSNKNQNFQYEGEDHTMEFDPQDIEKNKVLSSLAYLGILFFLPLVGCPDSKFGKFHANQGLVLFLAEVIFGAIGNLIRVVLLLVPFVGGAMATLINTVIGIVFVVALVMGLVNTLNGKAKEIPIIGKIKLIS